MGGGRVGRWVDGLGVSSTMHVLVGEWKDR